MNIEGVELIDLSVNRDHGGSRTTIYDLGDSHMDLPQWNLVRVNANGLGMEYQGRVAGASFQTRYKLPEIPFYVGI